MYARNDRIDTAETADIALSTLANDPIENALPNEPIDPMEKLDPIDPIDMNEFFDAIESVEFVEAMLHLLDMPQVSPSLAD